MMTVSVAKRAVLQAMERLARRGDRVFIWNVLEETPRVLPRDAGNEMPESLFWEAVEGLKRDGRIECHRDSQADWRILDKSEIDLDQIAEEAVSEAIETSIPANRFTVPDKAAKLLYRRAAARIAVGDASPLVDGAIKTLEVAGKIECYFQSNRDWRTVR